MPNRRRLKTMIYFAAAVILYVIAYVIFYDHGYEHRAQMQLLERVDARMKIIELRLMDNLTPEEFEAAKAEILANTK